MIDKNLGNKELQARIDDDCMNKELRKYIGVDYLIPVTQAKLSVLRHSHISFANVSFKTLVQIAFALEISIDELTGYTEFVNNLTDNNGI